MSVRGPRGVKATQATLRSVAGRRALRDRRREPWYQAMAQSGCKVLARLAVQTLLGSVLYDLKGLDR